MKASRLLQHLQLEHLLEGHHRRHSRFIRWGEQINARGLMITEDEVRHHQRLESLNDVQRYAN